MEVTEVQDLGQFFHVCRLSRLTWVSFLPVTFGEEDSSEHLSLTL
jgi:hypothetical protein